MASGDPIDAASERVLVIPDAGELGGAERSCLALVRWLHRQGLPHRIVTYSDRIPLRDQVPFHLVETELSPAPNAVAKIGALREFFRAHSFRYAPLISGIQGAMHAGAAGIRGYHTLMHDTPSLLSGYGERKPLRAMVNDFVGHYNLRRGLRSGGTTIVTSEFLKSESERYWGPPVEIARMGGMEGATRFEPRKVGERLRMLSVCRIEANKRIDWIIRALGEMERAPKPLSARVDWRLDLAGKGSQIDAMRGLAREQGLESRVVFHGFVSDDRLEEMYAEAHVFLMPAVQGYGIPAVEALSRGIPVLLHRESGVSDILLDTPWCVVIQGDESGMREGMERIVETVLTGRHLDVPPPRIPTESEWAERVARLCGWLD